MPERVSEIQDVPARASEIEEEPTSFQLASNFSSEFKVVKANMYRYSVNYEPQMVSPVGTVRAR